MGTSAPDTTANPTQRQVTVTRQTVQEDEEDENGAIDLSDFDIVDPNENKESKNENTMHWSIWIVIGASSALLIIGCIIFFILYRRRSNDNKERAMPNSPKTSMVIDKADDDYWAAKMRQLDTEARLSTGMPVEFDPDVEMQDDDQRRGSV